MANYKVFNNSRFFENISSLLEDGKDVKILVKGDSMQPFIKGGRDYVTLQKSDTYNIGDIVLANAIDFYNRKRVFILHRIVSISNGTITLMGDGNIKNYEYCKITDIKGKAIILHKNGQKLPIPNATLWIKLKPIRRLLLAINRRIS